MITCLNDITIGNNKIIELQKIDENIRKIEVILVSFLFY